VELVEGLSERLADYRAHENGVVVTPERVVKWVDQFDRIGLDRSDKRALLSELSGIFKVRYFSRARVKRILKSVLLGGTVFKDDIKEINFLKLQLPGRSQADLLLLINEILQEERDFSISDCGGGDTYFYVDDCIYSGNRMRYELGDWIRGSAPAAAKVISFHVVSHSQGELYCLGEVRNMALSRDIDFFPFVKYRYDNSRGQLASFGALWSKELDSPDVKKYAAEICAQANREKGFCPSLFRSKEVSGDSLFSSPENRELVERSFLRVGVELVSAAQSPARSMRPMGFEVLFSMGFGAMVASYRNIANNCPLALWYGDPDKYPKKHPLGKWLPLLPRKV
jgi:hypothetical protein